MAHRVLYDHRGSVLKEFITHEHEDDLLHVRTAQDLEPIVFPGNWSTDSRICLKAAAPRNVTILAAIGEGEMYA